MAQVEKEQRWLNTLARELPVPIPSPLAMGRPVPEYPWRWSVYGWLEGQPATVARPSSLEEFARDLAEFLRALHRIDAQDGPVAGEHNFHRGGPLAVYDQETREAIAALSGSIDAGAATALWQTALESTWERPRLWIHGDVAPENLLVRDGRLAAVIDFGCCGVGDPACDLTIAWTFFPTRSRDVFRQAMAMDDATWECARGWALWKALVQLRWGERTSRTVQTTRRALRDVLAG
jgi:aminoglycoside phosphotransferase (APT) family kinase protein